MVKEEGYLTTTDASILIAMVLDSAGSAKANVKWTFSSAISSFYPQLFRVLEKVKGQNMRVGPRNSVEIGAQSRIQGSALKV